MLTTVVITELTEYVLIFRVFTLKTLHNGKSQILHRFYCYYYYPDHYYLYLILPQTHKLLGILSLKGHCIEFKYYADGIHSGLTPPG